MKRVWRQCIGVIGAVAATTAVAAGAAHAAPPGPVYFSASIFTCSITPDGTVGCDTTQNPTMSISLSATNAGSVSGASIPVLFPVHEVLIDSPALPAHPGFDAGAPHTLPGGNPPLDRIANGHGGWGPSITFGGATCAEGFHGSFSCTSKGHSFTYYEAISAN